MPNIHRVDLVGMGAEAEVLVAKRLRAFGHSVTPGENYRHDLLVDGSVRVEVKLSHPSDGEWVWGFNSRKRLSDHCDVVVLIGEDQGRFHFFVFPSDHGVFYRNDGKPKAGIGVKVNPRRTHTTGQALSNHRDRWQLIREIRDGQRLQVSQASLW